jgi:hypothetical protein
MHVLSEVEGGRHVLINRKIFLTLAGFVHKRPRTEALLAGKLQFRVPSLEFRVLTETRDSKPETPEVRLTPRAILCRDFSSEQE